jgi:hypothetical protein
MFLAYTSKSTVRGSRMVENKAYGINKEASQYGIPYPMLRFLGTTFSAVNFFKITYESR